MEKKQKKNDECLELKNINYKTLLQTGNSLVNKDNTNLTLNKIDELLNDEKNANIATQSWPKLNSKMKLQIFFPTIQGYYVKEKEQEDLLPKLKLLLKSSKSNLQRTKDVVYDKKKQEITSIPRLEFKKDRFVFNKDNRQSTTKGLLKKKPKQNKTVKSKELN